MKVYQYIARYWESYRLLDLKENKHSDLLAHMQNAEEKIRNAVDLYMPSGSGFNSGTGFRFSLSKKDKLVFETVFYPMDENGYYDGHLTFYVIITPSLSYDFNIEFKGQSKNNYTYKKYWEGLKEYFEDEFYYSLNQDVKS